MTPHTPAPSERSAAETFARDVAAGLSATPKKIPSRYFYDQEGDRLFQEIMHLPEYYLSRCEYAIFKKHRAGMLAPFSSQDFDLVELGAGDGWKTRLLLEHLLSQNASFRYVPIDISQNALQLLTENLSHDFPDLPIVPIHDEYFHALHELRTLEDRPRLVLFLGSNIGNFAPPAAVNFLRQLGADLNPADRLLIGVDLKKDPRIILDAYDDQAGITAAFNLNLLSRINRELGGHFEVEKFAHWETYDPVSGAARSYIVSREKQRIAVDQLNLTVALDAWEAIEVELSQKYSLSEVEKLASDAGFQVCKHYLDDQAFFVDSVWKKTHPALSNE